MRKLWIFLTLAAVVASSAFSQTNTLKTAIGGTFINVPGSPLQIESFTQEATDLLSKVTVKNTSNKTVTHLAFAAVFGVPNGCTAGKFQQHHFESKDNPVSIAPGKTAVIQNVGLDPRVEYEKAVSAGATFVHWQIAVTRVEYSDGSKWQVPVSPGEMFSKARFASAGKTSCTATGAFKPVGI